MPTIDAQVHAYERNHPGRPWAGALQGPPEVTGDQMVAAMDAVGVDGAILVSPFSLYRYDASYALEVHAKHPDRFALVKPVDPTRPGVWRETIADVGGHAGHGRRAHHAEPRAHPTTPPIPASIASSRPPRATRCRSICSPGGGSSRRASWPRATPTRSW